MIKKIVVVLLLVSTSVLARPGSEASNDCTSCRSFVLFAGGISNDAENEAGLNEFCKNSGYGATKATCQPVIGGILYVGKFVASTNFCERTEMCPSDELFVAPLNSTDTNCDFCTNIMTQLKGIVTSRETENELKSQIAQACGYLGSFRDECTQLVDKNIDDWFDYIRNRMDPKQICQSLGFCLHAASPLLPKMSEIVNILPPGIVASENEDDEIIPFTTLQRTAVAIGKVSITPECIMCEQVTKMLIKKLKDNRTRVAIMKELDEVCDKLIPKDQRPECESLVSQYTEEMINLLVAETNPKVICKLLGVCTSTLSNPEQEGETSGDEGMFCGSCLLAREWISLQVSGNHSREALESALKQVCYSVVRKDDQEECREFVTQRLEHILNIYEAEPGAKSFCTRLELCGQRRFIETSPLADGLEIESDTKPKTLFPECYICKQIMHWLNIQLRNNRTEEAISAALQRVCPIFGHKIPNCSQQIEEYTERLIQVLRTATNADSGCVILGECTSVNPNIVESQHVSKMRSGEACFECESVAHFIQTELYDFNKEKQIDDWITHSLCDKMNNVLAKETCQSFIQEYGPSILNLIALKAFDPKVLCQQTLKLCPTTTNPIIVPEFELTNAKGGACDLCIDTVAKLDAYLASEETDKEIAEVAAQVCDEFEGRKKDQCVTIITVYGPYFMQMIGRLSDPRKVCKSVDICQITGQVHLLGGHKCTFGPTYWCHTSASAQACRATDYCLKSVWKPIDN